MSSTVAASKQIWTVIYVLKWAACVLTTGHAGAEEVHLEFWVIFFFPQYWDSQQIWPLCFFQHIAALHGSNSWIGFRTDVMNPHPRWTCLRFHRCLVFAVKQVGFLADMFENCYVTDAQRHVTRVSRSSSRRSQWALYYWRSESRSVNCWWGIPAPCVFRWNRECLGGWFLQFLWKQLSCRWVKVEGNWGIASCILIRSMKNTQSAVIAVVVNRYYCNTCANTFRD